MTKQRPELPTLLRRRQTATGMTVAQRQRGLSIIELLIGTTIGLFIAGMASFMAITIMTENSRLMIETRLIQDMRVAMDMMARELRRADYWKNAAYALPKTSGTQTPNPYSSPATTSTSITYGYDQNMDGKAENEKFGFALLNDEIKMIVAGDGTTYQPITDKNSLKVLSFNITPIEQIAPLPCVTPCADVTSTTCAKVTIRSYQITLKAQSASKLANSEVTRELTTRIRARNDIPSGAC